MLRLIIFSFFVLELGWFLNTKKQLLLIGVAFVVIEYGFSYLLYTIFLVSLPLLVVILSIYMALDILFTAKPNSVF